MKIVVVGAGIVGVTTALELQKRFRNAEVKIVADQFNEETLSFVAAGIFRPGKSFSGPTEEITRKWILDSYDYWEEIRKTTEAAKSGILQQSGYIFSSQFPELVRNSLLEKVCPIYRPATREELKLCPGNWKYGSHFTTIVTQSSIYIPWAIEKFLTHGGKLERHKIDSLENLGLTNEVVVNCTGLGAKFLCNDRHMVPIRGQVIKVKAPWLKNFFYADYDTYIIPGVDSVTLGGCRQYDSYDLTLNRYDMLKIQESCENLVPSLKNAQIISHKVGLRPHRSVVRVENERKNVNGKIVKIVHNYGHGGYGVTTAPGTALHACRLVEEALSGSSKL